jgi:hypothetical protein
LDIEPTSFIDFQMLLIEMERDRDKWKIMYEQLLSTFMNQGKKQEPTESLIRNEMYPRGRYHGD